MAPDSSGSSTFGRALPCLIFVAGVLGSLLMNETPTGRVHGVAFSKVTGKPLPNAHVVLTNNDRDSDVRVRRANTDRQGAFTIVDVRVGSYSMSASSESHQGENQDITVTEGALTDTSLPLARSSADLEAAPLKKTFSPDDDIFVPLRGYQDNPADKLTLSIYQGKFSDFARDAKLSAALGKAADRTEPGTGLDPVLLAHTHLLSKRQIAIKDADREGYFNDDVPLDIKEPGLYLISATSAKNQAATSWIVVTHMALFVKKAPGLAPRTAEWKDAANLGPPPASTGELGSVTGGRHCLAFVSDIEGGGRRSKVRVKVFENGGLLTSALTDAAGIARFQLPTGAADNRVTWLAVDGEDEAVLSNSDNNREDSGDYRVAAYTDRPVYRPGDTIYFKGIVRRLTEKASLDRAAAPGPYEVAARRDVGVELRDPQGNRLMAKSVVTNRYGSFWGATTLSTEASTGFYTLVSTVAGEEHTQDVQVAAYRKPEMTVTVTPAKAHYVSGDEVEMSLDGRYFFGSPVAGAKVRYEIYKDTDWRALYPENSDEVATDEEGEHSETYYGEYVRDGEVRLDASGHALVRFAAAAKAEDATEGSRDADAPPPQAEIWTLHVSLEDESGRSVEASGSAHVAAGDFHMDLKPDGYLANLGQPKLVTLTVKNFDDKPVAGRQVSIQWSYSVWNEEQQKSTSLPDGNLTVVTGPDGTANLQIPVTRGGSLQVTATAQDAARRPISAETSLWAVGGQAKQTDGQENTDGFALFADHQNYTAGQTAHVVIRSFRAGGSTALLTVEGDKLYHAWTVQLTGQSTAAQITLPDTYGPNVTLAACYVRDDKTAQTEIPLRVKVPERELQVEVKADGPRHLPGDKVTYSVSTRDASGKPVSCEFSLGVVDESVYAIAQDNPRLMKDIFYPSQSNRVQTSESLAVQYLGDTNKAAPNVRARRRFEDTAFWLPVNETGDDGKATVSCTLPDNLTQWRATVWAQTLNSRFGRAIGATVATKPFFVRLNRPRFTVMGDSTRIQGLVHNDTGSPQTANVVLQAPGLTTTAELTQQVNLAPGADVSVSWPVTVKTGENASALIKLTAWTQDRKWTDAVEEPLPVRPFGREKQNAYSGQLESGRRIEFMHEANAKAARTTLKLTPSPIDAFGGAFKYLIGFPYGCTEQTTSRMMPDLLMGRLTTVSGRTDLVDDQTRRDLPRMVNDSIVRLTNLQHGTGAWGWWNYDEDDAYLTAYALTGLELARQNGFNVPESVLKSAAAAALKMAHDKPAVHSPWAFANWMANRPGLLLAAAMAGQAPEALQQRGSITLQNLPTAALATLAIFDRTYGGQDARDDALRALKARSTTLGPETYWLDTTPAWTSDTSTVSDTAVALRALLAWDKHDPLASGAMRYLMNQRTGNFWDSTRDTSLTLGALVDYVVAFPSHGRRYSGVIISLNGAPMREVAFDKERELSVDIPALSLRDGKNTLQLQTEGNGDIGFYSLLVRRTVPESPLGPLSTKGIKLERQFFRVLKHSTATWKVAVEPVTGALNQGDDVRVRLTISNPIPLSYFLLEDAFAPGCEPTQRSNQDMTGADDWDFWWNSTEIRDDRIAFFCRTLPAGKHVIEYSLRAQTPGTYHVLPAVGCPMYAPQIRAETGASDLEIR